MTVSTVEPAPGNWPRSKRSDPPSVERVKVKVLLFDDSGRVNNLAGVPIFNIPLQKVVQHGGATPVLHLLEQGFKISFLLRILFVEMEDNVTAARKPPQALRYPLPPRSARASGSGL